ncbi:uncharacterized protein LOC133180650 [Saccostrea echinata]|uniref:uncharacterized protein LOC133180650 n=1 Tax=Saccostrea echinata TaxID=191078 RepID=UPI002A8051BB|nr:uncharacterized protein LOC133180650 [Saccostrea echinata]
MVTTYQVVLTCSQTEQSMKLVNILCEWPRMDLPKNKGTGNIQGYNIATMFAKDIKTKLKEILELEEGDKRCYEPHWRYLRWIDRNDLTDHNVMNNSVKGMEERNKLFHKERWAEMSALVLEEFGLFKPKTIIGLFSPPGYYLSLKNCNNGKLMATLEDETGQRLNEGVGYFKDVLLVEARIIIASVVKNITYREAEELLYPLK